MKKLTLTLLTCLFILSPNVVLGETWGDLVKTDGLYYKKFTDVPFSGTVTGKQQGSFRNGKRHGPWVGYWNNGQLKYKGDYKNGKREGPWVRYWSKGQLYEKGNYKNGGKEGPWVSYHHNGQLWSKGDYKNGKREGPWVRYWKDGTVWEKLTGTYRNGVKVGK